MVSLTENLIKDEKVLAVCRRNWTFFLTLKNIGLILFALFLLPIVWYVSIIILAVVIFPAVMDYKNTELVLTNYRLMGRKGFLKTQRIDNKASYFIGNLIINSDFIFDAIDSKTIIIRSATGNCIFRKMKGADNMCNALFELSKESNMDTSVHLFGNI